MYRFFLQKTQQVQQNKNLAAQRSQACPACRKPLPRCSVCLIHMGGITSVVESGYLVKKPSPSKRRSKPFNLFFTWCQTCRHGGHASHLIDWFSEHQVPIWMEIHKTTLRRFVRFGDLIRPLDFSDLKEVFETDILIG